MSVSDDRSVEQRLEEVEERLADLRYTVDRLAYTIERRHGTQSRSVAAQSPPRNAPRSTPSTEPAAETDAFTRTRRKPSTSTMFKEPGSLFASASLVERGSEYWLSRVGIGLVLFGVVFLFKYAVDQGWLTPAARVALGAALATTLYVLGLKLHFEKPWFGRILLGGGIAAFYITGFAATQLYALVSYQVGFGFMLSVTVLAFYSAVWQDQPVLSVIGAIGGFATPFLLTSDAGTAIGFATYVSALTIGASTMFYFMGWSTLLWVSVVGGWGALAAGAQIAGVFGVNLPAGDRWAFQGAALVAWLAFWLSPAARELRTRQESDQPGESSPKFAASMSAVRGREAHLMAVAMPVVALGFSSAIWSMPAALWGWIAIAGAVLYAAAGQALYRAGKTGLGFSHVASGAVLLTIALGILLDGGWLLLAWAAEATALNYIGARTRTKMTTSSGHMLFAIVLIWLTVRLLGDAATGMVVFNAIALTDLAVIGLVVATARVLHSADERWGYLLVAHAALLTWLWRELTQLTNGSGYVTIAWGVYAIILVVTALLGGIVPVRNAALGTLILVVGKLFLVDLANVEDIWRIMLFLGFGLVFLTLSYYFRSLWDPGAKREANGDGG